MRYFFILGTNPALSVAEVLAVMRGEKFEVVAGSEQVLIIEAVENLDTTKLIARLGGTIKIGHVIDDVTKQTLVETAAGLLMQKRPTGKISFGFSFYSLSRGNTADNLAKRFRTLGMETKKVLKNAGMSARWVKAQSGNALSSVVVQKDIFPSGMEFVVIADGEKFLLGVTSEVQPFELFSQTDFGRPDRSAKSGMLPPKLARMMLNLTGAQPSSTLWDPFCGSGTVITEALHLGVETIFASDLKPEAVDATQKNIAWLAERGYFKIKTPPLLFPHEARQQPRQIPAGSVDCIVSEPLLGPPRNGKETKTELLSRLTELTSLYSQALKAWKPLLAADARIVLALPLYIFGSEKLTIDLAQIIGNDYIIDSPIEPKLLQRFELSKTTGHGLLYGRESQLVWREIIRLKCN